MTQTTCMHCNGDMTEPNDDCKCIQRCKYCRSWIENEPAHEDGCIAIPKIEKVIISKDDIEIGQRGDTNEDSYAGMDYGYYILFRSYQTKQAVQKVIECITKEASGSA